jgi:hypothetical protein
VLTANPTSTRSSKFQRVLEVRKLNPAATAAAATAPCHTNSHPTDKLSRTLVALPETYASHNGWQSAARSRSQMLAMLTLTIGSALGSNVAGRLIALTAISCSFNEIVLPSCDRSAKVLENASQ